MTGDGGAYRYLVESIRKFPPPERFAEMIGEAGFARVDVHAPERGHRRDPLGLEALIMAILSSLGHVLRLTRAAFVFAREGAFVGVDPVPLPPVLRPPLAFANLIAKRDGDGLAGLSRAIDRLGPSYVKLGQFLSTRPDIVGGKVAIGA